MKYIIGTIIGILLASGAVVYAKTHGMELVQTLDYSTLGTVDKIYDNDNGVVCYMNHYGYSGGISCLK